MGQNLALNMNDHGFSVVVYNRTAEKTKQFLSQEARESQIRGAFSLQELVVALKRPRRILIMVKAGEAVDSCIDQLLPYLEKGDILIDGGNSLFTDTQRRVETLEKKGILFLGVGISGGEEGARHGPSMMPGGNEAAWPYVKPIFQAIAAKVNGDEPCCDWVGDGGAGHYVKMVHNGIEYGDMQLICEAYHLLKERLGWDNGALSAIFSRWNGGVLNSYLIEITSAILAHRDPAGAYLVDQILDAAGQKGTGKWTVNSALDLAIPLTLVGEAVFARFLSALKEERVEASKCFSRPTNSGESDPELFIDAVEQALYASKMVSYAQGFMLMRAAAHQYHWKLNMGAVALMWRGGCIIKSQFLGPIKKAFDKNSDLPSLFLDSFFQEALNKAQKGWRQVVATGALSGVPLPAQSAALAFFDGYTTADLPANLLQAQRDFFGAHTYERKDAPRGQFFHTEWRNEQ